MTKLSTGDWKFTYQPGWSSTYHPSDIAGLSWFSHASPSTQQNGLYSYKGYLKTPNTTC